MTVKTIAERAAAASLSRRSLFCFDRNDGGIGAARRNGTAGGDSAISRSPGADFS